jgi:hypothetical protein
MGKQRSLGSKVNKYPGMQSINGAIIEGVSSGVYDLEL